LILSEKRVNYTAPHHISSNPGSNKIATFMIRVMNYHYN
jgi:hypothetical protein